jgi:nucleotide-binding universal stress UspA family protein
MNKLRSILLHFDAAPRSAARLALARDLAAQHEAALTALYAVWPSYLAMPFALSEGSAGVLPVLEQMDAERRVAARTLFDREGGAGAAATRWVDLGNEPVIDGFATQALYSDLMLLGQHDPDEPRTEGVPADFVESVLIASGKPALIVPYTGSFASVGRDVLVAWKPTREAARAVAGALPLLQRARSVHVVGDTPSAGAEGRLDLAGYLRSHGIEPKITHHGRATTDVGEALLSLAADVQADLLVMGCYGHSRARELVLGGATRTVLNSMTLPVLMSH